MWELQGNNTSSHSLKTSKSSGLRPRGVEKSGARGPGPKMTVAAISK